MNKRKIIYISVIILLIIFFIILFSYPKENNKIKNAEKTTVFSSYMVKEFNGKIAVFRGNDNRPIKIFDTYTESLPTHDRQILKSGIKVNTENELQVIIEDYVK